MSFATTTARLNLVEQTNSELKKELKSANKELCKQNINVQNMQKSIDELKDELKKQKDTQDNYKIEKNSFESKFKETEILVNSQNARIWC